MSSSSTPYDAGDVREERERPDEVDVQQPSTIYGQVAAEISVLIERQKEKEKESPRRTSPKKSLQLSPKDLEEHISKIISQNAAIVETDPLYRKVSKDSKASTRRFSSFDLGRSKLQSALLAGKLKSPSLCKKEENVEVTNYHGVARSATFKITLRSFVRRINKYVHIYSFI